MRYFLITTLLFLFFQIEISGQQELLSADFYEILNTSDDVVLLDVRIKEKYLEDRIPGAEYAGEKSVLLKKTAKLNKDTKILVYCDKGERSASVLKILKNEGFLYIFHLEEGYDKWKTKGFPVDDSQIENNEN